MPKVAWRAAVRFADPVPEILLLGRSGRASFQIARNSRPGRRRAEQASGADWWPVMTAELAAATSCRTPMQPRRRDNRLREQWIRAPDAFDFGCLSRPPGFQPRPCLQGQPGWDRLSGASGTTAADGQCVLTAMSVRKYP